MSLQSEILGITVSKMPHTTRYFEGETEPDLAGGELSIVYMDGTTKTIPMVDDMESFIIEDKVIIHCLGKTAKFPIYVSRGAGHSGAREIPRATASPSPGASPIPAPVKKKPPPIMNGKYQYVEADWEVVPFYSGTRNLRFVDDKELEEIIDD